MKSTFAFEKLSLMTEPAGVVRSFRPLATEDTARLAQFYLQLDDDQRRLRFGGTLADGAVRKHCRQIDWTRSLVMAALNSSAVEAALEIHAIGDDWHRVELAFACRVMDDEILIIGHLLQLAAFAAGRLGSREFVTALDVTGCILLPFLHDMGEVSFQDDMAIVKLGDYATLCAGPARPTMMNRSKASQSACTPETFHPITGDLIP